MLEQENYKNLFIVFLVFFFQNNIYIYFTQEMHYSVSIIKPNFNGPSEIKFQLSFLSQFPGNFCMLFSTFTVVYT